MTALIEDFGVETLVVSDTDTVWLRNPTPYLEDHPIADWFISTDCLSHSVSFSFVPGVTVWRWLLPPGGGGGFQSAGCLRWWWWWWRCGWRCCC